MLALVLVDKAPHRSSDTVHNPHRPALYISGTSSYDGIRVNATIRRPVAPFANMD